MSDKPARICYFDDDPQHRELVGKFLQSQGFVLDICTDGASAIKSANESRPDLILADILMPGMNGLLTVKQMRDVGITSPVIFLTNFDQHDIDKADLKELNATKVLLKASVNLHGLLAEINEVLAQNHDGLAGVDSN